MELFNYQDYADRVGCSRPYLYKLINKGKIKPVKRGKTKYIDAIKADPVLKFKPASRFTPLKPKPKKGKPNPPANTATEMSSTEPAPGMDINELERIKTFQQARKLQLENDVKEGKLIDADGARSAFFEAARKTRDKILAVPARVAALTVNQDEHTIEMMLTEELKKALEIIAGDVIH